MSRKSGFTLLEVLLALLLVSIISMTIWTTFTNAFMIKEKLEVIEERAHSVRSLFYYMGRDLSMAYFVKDKKYHTQFKGIDNGLNDELQFTTFSRRIYPEQDRVSDQVIVSYHVVPNQDDPALLDVVRWSNPYIVEENYWLPKSKAVPVLIGIKAFDLEYHDGNAYKKQWDSVSPDDSGKIPRAVKAIIKTSDDSTFYNVFMVELNKPLGETKLVAPSTGKKENNDGQGDVDKENNEQKSDNNNNNENDQNDGQLEGDDGEVGSGDDS